MDGERGELYGLPKGTTGYRDCYRLEGFRYLEDIGYTVIEDSDLVHQLGTEQLRGGRLPYLDACAESPGQCDEYPVLTMWTMRVSAWVSGPSTTGSSTRARS